MEPRYDVLLRGGNPLGHSQNTDIALLNGKIAGVGPCLPGMAAMELDVTGKLISPSFVDSHMHLDKVLIEGDREADGTLDAVKITLEHAQKLPWEDIVSDVKRRACKVIDWELQNGAGTLKSHVYANAVWGLEALHALHQLKQEYSGRIDLLTVVPWYHDFDDALDVQLDELAAAGWVDFVGGYLYAVPHYRELADKAFEKANRFGLPLDIHVDEADAGNVQAFEYVLDKTLAEGMQGRVSCGHVTALAAADEVTAARLIEKSARAQVNIIALPSCNMYLMGRHDGALKRRGVTRIQQFLQAGVNVAYASDNVRDPFRPFGNGDMLEEGLFCAQVMQYGQKAQLETIWDMGTRNPAANCLLADYGIAPSCQADLVVLDAASPSEALISQCKKIHIFKNGKLVVLT